MPVSPYPTPQLWEDPSAALPCFQFATVTIHCTVAPTTPRTIKAGPTSGTTSVRAAVSNSAGAFGTASTIGAVGTYSLANPGFVQLGTESSDGTFYISAGA